MGDESFPSIQYVQPDRGENLLPSLIALMSHFNTMKNQGDENKYLKANPYQNATNSGALDAAMKIFGGKEGEARTGELGDEGKAALTNAASRQTEVGNEGAYQTGMLANDKTRTTNEGNYQSGMLNNDNTRVANEDFDRSQTNATNVLKDSRENDYRDKLLQFDQNKDASDNAEKGDNKQLQYLTGLHDNYARQRAQMPDGKLPGDMEDKANAVDDALFKQAGVNYTPKTISASAPSNALPDISGAKGDSGQANHTRLGQLVDHARKMMGGGSTLDHIGAVNPLVNDMRGIYNYATVPSDQPLPSTPGIGDTIASLGTAMVNPGNLTPEQQQRLLAVHLLKQQSSKGH